jgi:acetoin utilization deacetylase AcuC-like enzyme
MDHTLGPGHPESPERLSAIVTLMQQSGLDKEVAPVAPIDDPMPYIRMNHSDDHIAAIRRIPQTGPIAALAVAGVCGAVRAVSEGSVRNAFCAIRPPGHHADNTGMEEGFCFYNNIAIAARYAQTSCSHKKILIIDWDYHHGNGTEASFYSDPTVLFFSTHHWFAYPGTGDPARTGIGPGKGYNINVPLQPGATDHDIVAAWEKQLLPAAESFNPDFVLISAGFDSREEDLLGCFSVTDAGFTQLTKMALTIARNHCDGRLVSVLEGGYTVQGLASAVVTHVRALMDDA